MRPAKAQYEQGGGCSQFVRPNTPRLASLLNNFLHDFATLRDVFVLSVEICLAGKVIPRVWTCVGHSDTAVVQIPSRCGLMVTSFFQIWRAFPRISAWCARNWTRSAPKLGLHVSIWCLIMQIPGRIMRNSGRIVRNQSRTVRAPGLCARE